MRAVLTLCYLLLPASYLPAAITIDDFSTGSLAFNSPDSISQEGLDSNSVLGGRRMVSGTVLGSASMDVSINTTEGLFSFTGGDFGYFSVTYSIDLAHQIDLLASGDTAFLLDFSYVDPGFTRGGFYLSVDGVRQTISTELFALDGPGTIEVPFSEFTSGTSFTPSEIVFSADRFEPNLRLELSSITTIPEPRSSGLICMGLSVAAWIRCRKRRSTTSSAALVDPKA